MIAQRIADCVGELVFARSPKNSNACFLLFISINEKN